MASKQKGVIPGIPKIVSDYFFIGRRRPKERSERVREDEEAEREGQTPILVIKDTLSKSLFAHACPRKGAEESVVKRVIADLESLGYKRVLVRTDGEPAILDLWARVKQEWTGEVVKVEAATGDHDSNGEAEQAVQKVEDEVRTWKSTLDDAIGDRILPSHPILTWMVEHVSSIDRGGSGR